MLLALALAVAPRVGVFADEPLPDSPRLELRVPSTGPFDSDSEPESADGQPLYWIIDSRQAAQHRLDHHWGCLTYLQRDSDGSLRAADARAFQAALAPGVPVAVFVHGSFIEWDTQLRYAEATYHWIRAAAPHRPLHVVFYTWPSGAPYTRLFAIDVNVRGARAEFNGFHLAHVIAQTPRESPVCLVGHSHGARASLSALHLTAGGQVQERVFVGNADRTRRLRAVLAAAAVDHNWLNPDERYGCVLHRADVVNLLNRNDLALRFYPLARPFARPALANTGFTDGDRRDLGPLGRRAIDLDVSEVIQEAHTWPNYLRNPGLATAIAPFVYFTDPVARPVTGSADAIDGPLTGKIATGVESRIQPAF